MEKNTGDSLSKLDVIPFGVQYVNMIYLQYVYIYIYKYVPDFQTHVGQKNEQKHIRIGIV